MRVLHVGYLTSLTMLEKLNKDHSRHAQELQTRKEILMQQAG